MDPSPSAAPTRAGLFMGRGFPRPVKHVVTAWFGSFLVDGDSVERSALSPREPAELAERAHLRRTGHLTPEEEELLRGGPHPEWRTRDRRLAEHGLTFDPEAPLAPPASTSRGDRSLLAVALLKDAERSLEESWDPSVHVQEAVRAASDLDRVRNLIGERLGSWASRDFPDIDPGDHAKAARAAAEGTSRPGLGPADPGLLEARRRLAEVYRAVADARRALEDAVAASSPARTPNLTALLGPELAARLVAQAGGLDRLARLPSSTVQVLGAERAFFEHLRGRAPPPRHGLLFLHPAIQSSPRSERGKLARALAGKVAIAARLDHGGAPVNPSLSAAFEARRAQVRARRGRPRESGGAKPGSGLPLDRTARNR
jgi:nucleolar protein 56